VPIKRLPAPYRDPDSVAEYISRQWEELMAGNDMCPHGVWPRDDCVECGPFQGRVYLARCFLCDALTWHGLEDQRCLRCGSLGNPPTDDGTVAR
jgi:hypothetical protein